MHCRGSDNPSEMSISVHLACTRNQDSRKCSVYRIKHWVLRSLTISLPSMPQQYCAPPLRLISDGSTTRPLARQGSRSSLFCLFSRWFLKKRAAALAMTVSVVSITRRWCAPAAKYVLHVLLKYLSAGCRGQRRRISSSRRNRTRLPAEL